MLRSLKCIGLLTLLCVPFNVLGAVVVVDQESLSIPGTPNSGGLGRFHILNHDTYALLTAKGVIELDTNFRQLNAYKFDEVYRYHVEFVRVEDELFVVGQTNKFRLLYERNDIHLLRYGDSAPSKVWKCGSKCLHPTIVHFFNYENPALAWENHRKGRQYVRVVQLGTKREWKLDTSGFKPWLYRIGYSLESRGLQDVFVDLIKVEFRWWKVPLETHVKTIRLSDLNLLEETPKHLNEYKGVPEGHQFQEPSPGYQSPMQETKATPRSHFWADTKARKARIGIHEKDWSVRDHDDAEENGHLWWKVKTQYGIKHHVKTWYPQELNCRTASGEPFDSYLLIAEGGICMRTCGSSIYELRPEGRWREVFYNPLYQHRFNIDLKRKDQIHIAFGGNLVQLDRGVDYCVEDLERFQPSLP